MYPLAKGVLHYSFEWNSAITENLFEGAKETLLRHGVAAKFIHRLDVPEVLN